MADKSGKIIIEPIYGKIKALGEYILVKQGKYYQVYDSNGKLLSDKHYKKIRLNRNTLEGKQNNGEWTRVNLSL